MLKKNNTSSCFQWFIDITPTPPPPPGKLKLNIKYKTLIITYMVTIIIYYLSDITVSYPCNSLDMTLV